MSGEGIKIAIVAFGGAEGDVDIEGLDGWTGGFGGGGEGRKWRLGLRVRAGGKDVEGFVWNVVFGMACICWHFCWLSAGGANFP